MAAYALRAMEHGASLLTGARPGGAGKTTLMAAILHLCAAGRADRDRRGAADAPRRPLTPGPSPGAGEGRRGGASSGAGEGRAAVLSGPRDRRRALVRLSLGKSRGPLRVGSSGPSGESPRASMLDTLEELAGVLNAQRLARHCARPGPRRADPLHARRPLAKRLSPPRGDVLRGRRQPAPIGSSSPGTPSPTRSAHRLVCEPKGLGRRGVYLPTRRRRRLRRCLRLRRKVLAFYERTVPEGWAGRRVPPRV